MSEETKESMPWKVAVAGDRPYWDNDYTFLALRENAKKYIKLQDPGHYDLLVAWTMATWRIEEWRAFNPLYLLGDYGSGKTTVLEWLEETAFCAIRGGSMSTSVMFHLSNLYPAPTLLLDESQMYNGDEWVETQALINESYRKGGKVWRMSGEGRNMKPQSFNAFGPRAFAATWPPWPALADRVLLVHMEETEEELGESLSQEFFVEGEDLRGHLAAYRGRCETPSFGDSKEKIEAVKTLLKATVKNHRVQEAGFPLLMVTPEGETRENILRFLKEMEAGRRMRKQTGYLADYIMAMDGAVVENGMVGVREIRARLMLLWDVEDKKDKRLPGSKKILQALETLGFSRARTRDNTAGVRYDERLLLNLKASYGLLATPGTPGTPAPIEKRAGEAGEAGEAEPGQRILT
jgi:hypothetical protein